MEEGMQPLMQLHQLLHQHLYWDRFLKVSNQYGLIVM